MLSLQVASCCEPEMFAGSFAEKSAVTDYSVLGQHLCTRDLNRHQGLQSMCLSENLLQRQQFNKTDNFRKYCYWYARYSLSGHDGIGGMVRRVDQIEGRLTGSVGEHITSWDQLLDCCKTQSTSFHIRINATSAISHCQRRRKDSRVITWYITTLRTMRSNNAALRRDLMEHEIQVLQTVCLLVLRPDCYISDSICLCPPMSVHIPTSDISSAFS